MKEHKVQYKEIVDTLVSTLKTTNSINALYIIGTLMLLVEQTYDGATRNELYEAVETLTKSVRDTCDEEASALFNEYAYKILKYTRGYEEPVSTKFN